MELFATSSRVMLYRKSFEYCHTSHTFSASRYFFKTKNVIFIMRLYDNIQFLLST